MISRGDIDHGVMARRVRGRFYPIGNAWCVSLMGEEGKAYTGRGVTLSAAFEDAFRDYDQQRTRVEGARR